MARSEGKRPEPRKRVPAKPAPKRPNLPAAEVEQKSSGLGKKVLIAGVGLAVLAGLTALSLGLANETDPAESLPAVTVEVSGDLLPPFADPSNDAAVGLVAPEITSVDFAGAPAAISNDGTPKMILFLAHWCLPLPTRGTGAPILDRGERPPQRCRLRLRGDIHRRDPVQVSTQRLAGR